MGNIKKKVFNIFTVFMIFCIILSNYSSISASKTAENVNSAAAVVIDYETGRVLYEKQAYEKRAMASLTKVMTAIMLVEYCRMDELIEVPAAATWQGGSEVGLKKGDKVTAKALLYGMMLPSGNDCAYTVATYIGGTIEEFATKMTNKARQIGATNTSFVTPHGLDAPSHYSTAYDMALITKYALENKYINEAVNTTSATINFGSFSKILTNTNRLLKTYDYIDGVKTGFTNNANRCLIASATKNDFRVIAVVLGAETTDIRFNDAKKLIDASFENYKPEDISNYMKWYIKVPIIKGKQEYFETSITKNMKYPLTKEEYEKIYIKQNTVPSLEAPVLKGTRMANIEICIENEKIYEEEVIIDYDIEKKQIIDYFSMGLRDAFKIKHTI